MTQAYDLIVLGAGVVGVSTALHARRRGLNVALVDRRGPGEETSYGNTGVVDGANVFPVAMPRSLGALARHALNRETAAHHHPSALPRLAPWLYAYWRASSPSQLEETARLMRPMLAQAVADHRELQGVARAERYFRQTGWLKLHRSEATLAATRRELTLAAEFGLATEALTRGETLDLEPHLKPAFAGAIYHRDADTCSNPGAATRAYAQAFVTGGGLVIRGDAMTLQETGVGYQVMTDAGTIGAPRAVVALGPWAGDLVSRLGYRVPLAAKRGYHLHFAARGNATLSRPVCDMDVGYCLAPMEQGVRLTTGVEFALRDAPKTPVQVERARKAVADLFDLAYPVEAEAWMGQRPATPDSRPVIGPAPRHEGLWFAFGHGHWGFALGPTTGKAVAAAIVGEKPAFDLAPYGVGRF